MGLMSQRGAIMRFTLESSAIKQMHDNDVMKNVGLNMIPTFLIANRLKEKDQQK